MDLKWQHRMDIAEVFGCCWWYVECALQTVGDCRYSTLSRPPSTPPDRGVEYCDEHVCLCICRRGCKHISRTALAILTKFLWMLSIAATRSFSSGIVIRLYGWCHYTWWLGIGCAYSSVPFPLHIQSDSTGAAQHILKPTQKMAALDRGWSLIFIRAAD